MILNNNYIVKPTASFKKELSQISYYLKYILKAPSLAKNFYKDTIREISFLSFMPERFEKIIIPNKESKNIRKLLINKYVIIFEIYKETGQVFILHIFHSSQNYLNML